ncbi:MAG TPA: hypothetical protein VHW47_06525, partial [Acidimicrobiales bacterium]|nr:hypothetical protein [Acidimicrobiales bacterium]
MLFGTSLAVGAIASCGPAGALGLTTRSAAVGRSAQPGQLISAASPISVAQSQPPAQPVAVPYQYVAKAYTELLGRAPTPSEWAAAVRYFRQAGCSAGSLRRFGDRLVTSKEYRLDYPVGPRTAGAIVLTLYRFVLNREPDPTGYVENRDQIATGRASPILAADDLFATNEFKDLTEPAICDPSNPSYYFGEPGDWTGHPAMPTPD